MGNDLSLLTVSTQIFEFLQQGKDEKWLFVWPTESYTVFLSQVHKIISFRSARHIEIDIVSLAFGIIPHL